MPRTTNNEYLMRHHAIRRLWQEFPETFIVLPPHQQWQVHRYYQTQVEADDITLIRIRRELTTAEPSLPQAAGKAGAVLARAFKVASDYGQGDTIQFRQGLNWIADQRMPKRPGQQVVIRAVVLPAPDTELLARALLQLLKAEHDRDIEAEAA